MLMFLLFCGCFLLFVCLFVCVCMCVCVCVCVRARVCVSPMVQHLTFSRAVRYEGPDTLT